MRSLLPNQPLRVGFLILMFVGLTMPILAGGGPRQWMNPAGGNWSNPANWLGGDVPDSNIENAVLDLDTSTPIVIVLDINVQIASFSITNSMSNTKLVVDGQTLEITETIVNSTVGQGGELEIGPTGTSQVFGMGNIEVLDGTLTFAGGTLSGPGTMLVGGLGSLSLTGGNAKNFNNRATSIDSNAFWAQGNVSMMDTSFTIGSLGAFDISSPDTMTGMGTSQLINDGQIQRSGAGITHLQIPTMGTGPITLQSGDLAFTAPVNMSGVVLDVMDIMSNFSFLANAMFNGCTFQGPGSFHLDSAVFNFVTLNSDIAAGAQVFGGMGGTFMGDTGLDNSGNLIFDSVAVQGDLQINNLSGAVLNLNTVNLEANSSIVNNSGATVNWQMGNLGLNGNAVIANSGDFNIFSTGALTSDGLGTAAFNNLGMLTKTSPGPNEIMAPFTNNGVVNANNGFLRLLAGGNSAGQFNLTMPGGVDFGGDTFDLQMTGTVTGDGPAKFSGGTTNVDGTFTVTGQVEVVGGDVNFAMGGTIDITQLDFFAGVIRGPTNLNILNQLNWEQGMFSDMATVDIDALAAVQMTTAGLKELTNGRTIIHNGVGNWSDGNFSLSGGSVFDNRGQILIQGDLSLKEGTGPGNMILNSGVFHKDAGPGMATVEVGLQNDGDLRVSSGTLAFSNTVTQNSGRTEMVSADFDFQSGLQVLGGELIGEGQVGGNINVVTAMIKPGLMGGNLGTMTFLNDLTLDATTTTEFQIDPTIAPTLFDKILVNGTASLAGSADVLLPPGAFPPAGELYQLLTAGTLVGQFMPVNVPPGMNGAMLQPNHVSNEFQIEVQPIAPPSNPQIFVADQMNQTVFFADPLSGALNTQVSGALDTFTLAVSPDGQMLAIPGFGSNNLLLVDTVTDQILADIPGFSEPLAAAFNASGSRVWVLNGNIGIISTKRGVSEGFISIVDTMTFGQVGMVNNTCMANVVNIAFNPVTQHFYVLSFPGTVCVFDTSGNFVTSVALPTSSTPEAMVVSPDGMTVYASDSASSLLLKFDAVTFATDSLVLSSPPKDLDIDDTGQRLFLAADPDRILEIDTGQFIEINSVPVTGAMGLAGMTVLPSLNVGFVTDPLDGTIYSFSLDNFVINQVANGLGQPKPIVDNDVTVQAPGELRFSQMTFQANEGDVQALIQVERIGGFSGALNGLVATTDDTAIAGEDYQATSQTVQFANGEAGVKTVAVPILDDNLIEGDERLTLNLSPADGGTNIASPNTAELIIRDNESGLFQLDQASYVVNEASGQLTLDVVRLGNPLGDVDLTVVPMDGTAIADFDFVPTPKTVSFADGEGGSKKVNIAIVNDAVGERQETFSVGLQVTGGNGVLGTPSLAEVIIVDDDPVIVTFSTAEASVSEPAAGKRATTVSVRVETDRIADFPVIYNFGIEGTASPGLDHTLGQTSGIIPIGRLSDTIEFDILPDDEVEADETVVLTLQAASGPIGIPNQWTLTILDEDRRQPTPRVKILSPATDSRWPTSMPVPFLAEVTLDGEAQVQWEICRSVGDCIKREGLGFSMMLPSGEYQAICIATNLETGDVSNAAKSRFRVTQGEPRSRVRIVSPDRRGIQLGVGELQNFQAEADAMGETPPVIEWLFAGTDQVLGTGNQFQYRFEVPGEFTLIARIEGSTELDARDWRDIRVAQMGNRSPQVMIEAPEEGTVIDVGDALTFIGKVVDPDGGGRNIPLMWDFGDGRMAEGNQVDDVVFNQAGRFQIRLFGRVQGQRVSDHISIFVRNPGVGPQVDMRPATDLQIHPYDPLIPGSGEVFFRPVIRNDRGFRNFDYFWDFGNGQTSQADVPGVIRYDSEGTYTVTLMAKTDTGLESPVITRSVIVRKTDTESFEPNNDFDQAPMLRAGQYPNLAVDDQGSDFYQFNIESDGQSLVVRLSQNELAMVTLFDEARNPIRNEMLDENGRLQLVGLNAGTYFLQVQTPPGSKRLGVSYGLAIDVFNPSLYFPEVESSPDVATEIGIVNLSGGSTSVEVLGFDKDGSLLGREPLTLQGNGRVHMSTEALFPDDHRNVRWIEVDATRNVIGYSQTSSRDGEEQYAMTASKKRAASLFVPHIAEQVEQWFTRAIVVNVDQDPGDGVVVTPGTEVPLVLDSGFKQDRFDFVERFGGELPENGIWARMNENSSKVNLVGAEVFGTKDGTRQVAGLELLDNQEDNPNFVYIANNLYFTHIASDVDTFYTGLALVNVGATPQSVRIYAYKADGSRFGPKTMTLGPNQKVVSLADEFLDGVGSVSDTDWVMVEADSDIAGFEVFGTRDGKRLAGLEATHALQSELCYPFIDPTGNTFHGVSLINPNDAPNNIVLTLYDNQGDVVATQQMVFSAGQKLVATMADLFPEAFDLEANGPIPGWLALEASLPTAGFELFTSKNSAKMGAILAK